VFELAVIFVLRTIMLVQRRVDLLKQQIDILHLRVDSGHRGVTTFRPPVPICESRAGVGPV
jgi:hypothetical protein